ncbi:MAG: hypothetical protein ACI867_000833, partial [Glaciecola sp.]
MSINRKAKAQSPSTATGELKVGARRTVAAGLPAVASSVKHLLGATGAAVGASALAKVNQKDGFDCP